MCTGDNEKKAENELLDLVSLDRSTNVNQIPNDGKKGHDLSVFSYACVMTAKQLLIRKQDWRGGLWRSFYGKFILLKKDGLINSCLMLAHTLLIKTSGKIADRAKNSRKATIKKFRTRNFYT